MKRIAIFIVFVIALISVVSCTKSNTGPNCSYTTSNIPAPDSQVVKLQTYLAMNSIPATKDTTGFFYAIDNPGTGLVPELCSKVGVQYKASFTDGTAFDSTGGSVAKFTLGQLIVGWQNGLPYIKSGGHIRLYIPPALAYGQAGVVDNSTGKVIVPPNSIVIFDINLVSVE